MEARDGADVEFLELYGAQLPHKNVFKRGKKWKYSSTAKCKSIIADDIITLIYFVLCPACGYCALHIMKPLKSS